MIRRFRTVVVGSYLNGVYRPVRVIQIPYSIPYPLGRAQTVAAGAGEVLVQGGAATVAYDRSVSPGAGEILVQGGAVTIRDDDTIAPGAGDVVVQGGAVSLSLQGVPAVEADHGGSGGQFEWFERRNREDEIILQVIAEFLKAA